MSQRFLIPCLTHQTQVKERQAMLEAFKNGTYKALVTSKVLNEGVDVPDASIGVILSGSGSTREFIQRLGRILRRGELKQAILYELVSRETARNAPRNDGGKRCGRIRRWEQHCLCFPRQIMPISGPR
ncbi:MAG: hypothetical protein HC808_07845 [Candidatus Competibacteraceae bacterium]|nr:hypothetical protein [Candidatus Competibacteraceae bacterium]